MRSIAQLGDALCAAYARRGVPVADNLNPGLRRENIIARLNALGLQPPEDLIALYEWRNGARHEYDDEGRLLLFRDNIFISLDRGIEEFQESLALYREESSLELDDVDLTQCFPISWFDGSYDTVACGAHRYPQASAHPVIRVFEDISLYFHSIPAMLETCIDWVNAPEWAPFEGLPDEVEMAIWRRHNPGIFDE